MKIIQVTKFYYPITGGQQTYIHNLHQVFKSSNIESAILQPHVKGYKNQAHVYFTKPIPLTYRFYSKKKNYQWYLFNLELLFSKKILKKSDILINHYSFHYPVLRWHPKVIIVSHGVLWSTKLDNSFDKKLNKQDLALRANKDVCIVANDTHFLRAIGYDIKVGEAFFKQVAPNVWFIPNCVDTHQFKEDSNIQKEKIVLVPRNIREDRGIHLAIESFHLFHKRFPEYHLKIVGGPLCGKYFEYCYTLVQKYQLQKKVTFEGFMPWDKMLFFYNQADFVLIPTLEKEGTSLSALEAMACGTAVVSTNVAGLADLPTLQAKPEANDIAKKMKELLQNKSQYQEYQKKQVQEVFNLNNWKRAWLEVVKAIEQIG